jgi:arylsulfatase A-like enzyme
LFIYINDNGWEQDADVEYKQAGSTWKNDLDYSNGGGKGKLGLYDQSFRTPVIFYWRNRIQGSFDTSTLVSMQDVVPTILDIAGVSPDKTPKALHGHSLKPLLEGRQQNVRDHIVGYAHQRRSENDMMGQRAEGYYVRTERWFFRWYKDNGTMELFDMQSDPRSENDVLDQFPHLIEPFKLQIEAWKNKVGMVEPIPVS